MRDWFGIFGAIIRIRKLSLLLVVTLRMPNTGHAVMPDVDRTFFTFDHVLLAALLLARSFAK